MRGKGGGTVVTIDGTFDLTESDGGTEMKWQTDVDLTVPSARCARACCRC